MAPPLPLINILLVDPVHNRVVPQMAMGHLGTAVA